MDSQHKHSILLKFVSVAAATVATYTISNIAAIFMKKKDYVEPFIKKYLFKKYTPIGKSEIMGMSCEVQRRELRFIKDDYVSTCKTPFGMNLRFIHAPKQDFSWVKNGFNKVVEMSNRFSVNNPFTANIDVVIYNDRFFLPLGTHNNLIEDKKHVVVVNAKPDVSPEIVLFHELIHVVQAESKNIFENTSQLMNNIDEFVVINESTARAMEYFAYNNYAVTPNELYKYAPNFVALVNNCGRDAITPYFKERHFNKDVAIKLAKKAPVCDEEVEIKRALEKYRENQ